MNEIIIVLAIICISCVLFKIGDVIKHYMTIKAKERADAEYIARKKKEKEELERAKDFIHFAIEHDSSICQYISLYHNHQNDVEDYITSKLHAMRLDYNHRYGFNTIFNTIDDIIVSGVYTDYVHVYVKPKQSAYYVIISLYHDGTIKIINKVSQS